MEIDKESYNDINMVAIRNQMVKINKHNYQEYFLQKIFITNIAHQYKSIFSWTNEILTNHIKIVKCNIIASF
jgi:hypothetical protein